MAADCNAEVKETQFSWALVLLTFEKLCMFFTEKNAYSLLERVKNRVFKPKLLGATTE